MQQILHGWILNLEFGTAALVIFAIVFSALEHNFSFRKLKKPWRSTWIDLQFYFANLLLPPIVRVGVAAAFAAFLTQRRPIAEISPWAFAGELFAVLFVFDVWTYSRHWAFHRFFWKVHSIHHSSEELNWLSGERNHCAEVAIDIAGELVVLMLAGIAGVHPRVIFYAGIVIGAWNFFVHANLRWTFGPLRYVLVSPMHHRWHHSDAPEAADKNFAVMFSCIDIALRTHYMPKDVLPKTTGLMGDERKSHPRTFVGQVLYPFRRTLHASVNDGVRNERRVEAQDRA